MKRFINILMVLAALAGIFYGVGFILPRSELASAKARLVAKPVKIYGVLSNVASWPEWHPDVASVRERERKSGHPVWRITTRSGLTYDLEVTAVDAESSWQAIYASDESNHILRYNLGWYGDGGRVHLSARVDTRDPWQRARFFFLRRSEATPEEILAALGEHLGESGVVAD